MDALTFAKKMVQWAELKKQLAQLEAELTPAVLEMGKTQAFGGVVAKYSSGRRTFDWESAARAHPEFDADLLSVYTRTTVSTTTDWKGMCQRLNITEPPVAAQSEPSVTFSVAE